MTTTRHATIDTDYSTRPITFPTPHTLQEIAEHVQQVMQREGEYVAHPIVTMGQDRIAHVSFAPCALESVDDILRAFA
jgi:hypothetical protein